MASRSALPLLRAGVLPELSAALFPAQMGSSAPAVQQLASRGGWQRRYMADAPGAKPAAAGGAAAPAKAAAKPGGGAGGAAGKKKKGKDDSASALEFPQIKYGYGALTRPSRQIVREKERAARLEALKKESSTPGSLVSSLAPAFAKLSGKVVEDDPILAALLKEETAKQGLLKAVETEYGAERLGRAEEPSDLSTHAATERMLGVLGDSLPPEFKPKLQAVRVESEEINTDVEDEDDAERAYNEAHDAIVKSQRAARPVLRSLPSQSAEDDARIEDMAKALLAGVDIKAKMAETAKVIGEDAEDMQAAAAVAMRAVRAPYGGKRSPEEFMGLHSTQAPLVDAALNRLTGVDSSTPMERLAGRTMLHDMLDDDPTSETYGKRLTGPWGADARSLNPGFLEDIASPFNFTSEDATAEEGEIDTLRESLMTPAERAVNERRKALRKLIEAPQPIAYRPAWPLYALIAGVDQVQQVVSGGMISSARCMVVVGNGMGGIGVGMVKHPDPASATKKALARAVRDMVHINTHKGALYHDLMGKKNGVYVILRALPSSAEVYKAAPLIADVLELAGITRYSAKIVGSHRGRRNPYVVTQALFDAFNHHYPPEREAYLRGLRPVWATADRVTRHTVYPQTPKGPRFPAANTRFQDTGRARA